MTREILSRHPTYEEAKKEYSKHDVQDNLQIRRRANGFVVARRIPSTGTAPSASAVVRGRRGRPPRTA